MERFGLFSKKYIFLGVAVAVVFFGFYASATKASLTFSGTSITGDSSITVTGTTTIPSLLFTQNASGSVARTLGDKLYDVVSVKDFGAKCNGITDDTAAITAAIAASNYIVIPSGSCVVSSNLTVPATVTLNIEDGALLQIASGSLLTINGGIDAGGWQIFSGNGTVDLSKDSIISEAHLKWWGAKGDASTNDTAAVNAAFTALTLNTGSIGRSLVGLLVDPGIYMVGNVSITNSNNPSGCGSTGNCYAPAYIRGVGIGLESEFRALPGTTGYVLSAIGVAHTVFDNFSVDGNSTAACMQSDWPTGGPSLINSYTDLYLLNCVGYGLHLSNQNDSTIERITAGMSPYRTGYGLYLEADGGSVFGLSHLDIYGKVFIDAQNAAINDSYLADGLELGHDSFDSFNIANTQIEAASDTDIVINSTHLNAIESLTCDNCYLAPSGLASSGAIFGGPWLMGAEINGGWINSATGTLFKNISTPSYQQYPLFTFTNTWFYGQDATWTIPSVGHYYVDFLNDRKQSNGSSFSSSDYPITQSCLEMNAASGTASTIIYLYYDSNAVQYATTTKPSFCN